MRFSIVVNGNAEDGYTASGPAQTLVGLKGTGGTPAIALGDFARVWAARLDKDRELKRIAAGLAKGPKEAAVAAFMVFNRTIGSWDGEDPEERAERLQERAIDAWEATREFLERNGVEVLWSHSCCGPVETTKKRDCPQDCGDCDGEFCGWTTNPEVVDMEEFDRIARGHFGEDWDAVTGC